MNTAVAIETESRAADDDKKPSPSLSGTLETSVPSEGAVEKSEKASATCRFRRAAGCCRLGGSARSSGPPVVRTHRAAHDGQHVEIVKRREGVEAQVDRLGPEIALVRDAIAAYKIVFDVCLGAQIIAKASGARVYPGSAKEIGWLPVERTRPHPLFDGLPDSFTAFHWHGETFELPHGAELLANSKITEIQAFAVGQRVLGLQFHLEATERSVRVLVNAATHEIGCGAFEQQPGIILANLGQCARLRPLLDTVLDRLAAFVGRSP